MSDPERRDSVHGQSSGGSGLLATTSDLVVVAGYAVLAGLAIVAGVAGGPARVLVAAPLLGFGPGYTVVAALFPARGGTVDDQPSSRWASGPTWVERLSLSVATSLVVLILAAIVLSLLGVSFQTGPLTATVVVVTVGSAVLAALRRRRLPAGQQLVVPVGGVVADIRAGTVDARPLDTVLNVVVVVAVVVAASTIVVGFAAPDHGEAYTDVALVSDDGDRLVAGNYTATVQRGDETTTTLTVSNNEGRDVDYTAVVVLERLQTNGSDAVVLERTELDRVDVSTREGQTVLEDLTVEPSMLGEDLRMSVYVYEGAAPDTATGETASHHLYLWLDVVRDDAAGA